MDNFLDLEFCRLSSNGGNVNKRIKTNLAWAPVFIF
jgi:hypothetical protein